jgi:putative drug exporter of the RND superfamily
VAVALERCRLAVAAGEDGTVSALGLAAGIIFDATVIRALLVPALMKLFGDANWWMPNWTSIVLRIPHRERAPEIAIEAA